VKTFALPISLFCILCLLLPGLSVNAQAPRYVISFTDKNNTPYRLDVPAAYLSARAIARRTRQHLAIDSTDLPVNPAYTDSLRLAGDVQVLYTLRWFNQAVIQTGDAAALQKIQQLPFIKTLVKGAGRMAAPGERRQRDNLTTPLARSTGAADVDYGNAYTQIHLHGGEYLHNKNLKGNGMLIAVLDGGFPSVNNNRAFAWLRSNNKIAYTRNLTNGTAAVYDFDDHGTHCLSILGANLPGELVGTAPEASYVLLRTEEAGVEQPVEESNWTAGVELADSLGVDVISSSLGYNTFDDPAYNHTYAQLNGHSLAITQAAALAVRKGMIVVTAAGNEGTTAWKYLLAPADADSVLTVGAVSSQGQVASFSSYGPTADGRIKPDVAGMGVNTALINTNGTVTGGNGTSYACPVIAGLVACLWQAFPQRTNMEIVQAVKASASQYTSPDNRMGYGIPNFHTAYDTLLRSEAGDTAFIRQQLANRLLKVFPNPFTTRLQVYYQSTGTQQPAYLQLIDAGGRLTRLWQLPAVSSYGYFTTQTGLEALPKGIYYLRWVQGTKKEVVKIIKL
jgi:subtilisin family serine protease